MGDHRRRIAGGDHPLAGPAALVGSPRSVKRFACAAVERGRQRPAHRCCVVGARPVVSNSTASACSPRSAAHQLVPTTATQPGLVTTAITPGVSSAAAVAILAGGRRHRGHALSRRRPCPAGGRRHPSARYRRPSTAGRGAAPMSDRPGCVRRGSDSGSGSGGVEPCGSLGQLTEFQPVAAAYDEARLGIARLPVDPPALRPPPCTAGCAPRPPPRAAASRMPRIEEEPPVTVKFIRIATSTRRPFAGIPSCASIPGKRSRELFLEQED
jgi:hypothetical protein